MRKFSYALLIPLLFSFFLLFQSCEAELINDPTCTDNRSVINRQIIPSVTIKYKDNVEYIGWFDFNIYKTYCTGIINGNYTEEGLTNENGYCGIGMVYTYKYEDGQDFVTIVIKVADEFGDETLTHDRYYYLYYDDVESQADLDDDIEVKLPWDSNGEQ